MEFIKLLKDINLEGYTLLVPTVSVGNLPQLTMDLFIKNFNFQKVGILWHPAIVPLVGGDPYGDDKSEICTACELYANETLKCALIQIRSTIEHKLALNFMEKLKEAVQSHKIKNIVILASSFDYELHTIEKGKLFYISNEEISEIMGSLSIRRLEQSFDEKYLVYGGGYTVKLYETLSSCLPCTVLVKYLSEGDNRPDAILTLEVLNKFMEQHIKGFKMNACSIEFPSSWDYVFGAPPRVDMY